MLTAEPCAIAGFGHQSNILLRPNSDWGQNVQVRIGPHSQYLLKRGPFKVKMARSPSIGVLDFGCFGHSAFAYSETFGPPSLCTTLAWVPFVAVSAFVSLIVIFVAQFCKVFA